MLLKKGLTRFKVTYRIQKYGKEWPADFSACRRICRYYRKNTASRLERYSRNWRKKRLRDNRIIKHMRHRAGRYVPTNRNKTTVCVYVFIRPPLQEQIQANLLHLSKKRIASSSSFMAFSSASVIFWNGVRFLPKSRPISFMIRFPPTILPR